MKAAEAFLGKSLFAQVEISPARWEPVNILRGKQSIAPALRSNVRLTLEVFRLRPIQRQAMDTFVPQRLAVGSSPFYASIDHN